VSDRTRVLALSGGIGGARLALGLHQILPQGHLTVVCNTGDDFEHLGLQISPDLDTVLYTLSGLANRELGWGRADETWSFMRVLEQLGGETWFQLGDGDLALHVERTRRLAAGESLSAITADFAARLGLATVIAPMSDRPVRTVVHTASGRLAFQHYFVRERCQPVVTGFEFAGARGAAPSPAFWQALYSEGLEAVVICPSNPFISIDPVLAVPGLRRALRASAVPVIAVSPVVAGAAVKGPTAKMMRELGVEVSATSVAERYRDIIDGFVLDESDAPLAAELDTPCLVTATLMHSDEVKRALASEVLAFARRLSS
jgi:LPPG:FO 2-phospho-L-lactate transferase